MVLLAGDLFHDNKPSRKAMQRCMEIMREQCLGDRPVSIEVVSDQASNFHSKWGQANFEDSNYNVSLPVFSIHGNHDDPAGDGGLAALDLLSTANLINYFGRCDNFERISLQPVLITKGATKLALCAPRRAVHLAAGWRARTHDARASRVVLVRVASCPRRSTARVCACSVGSVRALVTAGRAARVCCVCRRPRPRAR
jgi:DNA repair exonuclease SbcCD nuclease subunit